MSTRVLLVRHGESAWGADGRIQGQADPSLSERGRGQADALARGLAGRRVDAVYASPLHRARETAAAIAQPHGLEPVLVDAFQEVHLGAWQGRFQADLEGDDAFENWRRGSDLAPDLGGEALALAAARALPALHSIVARHADGSIVVVTHSIVGRVLVSHLLVDSAILVPRLKLKLASISILRLTPLGGVLERLGDVSHLEG